MAQYVPDQLHEDNFSNWQNVLGVAEPEIGNYWQHPPQQAAPTKAAAQLLGISCGQSQSGSSALSSDPYLDSAVLNNWQDNLLEPVPSLRQQLQQQAQQPVGLSRRNSIQPNQLPDMERLETDIGQQPGHAAAQSGSWHSVVLNEALARAASRICKEEEEDLDLALQMIRQDQQQKHQDQQQLQQSTPDVLHDAALLHASHGNLQDDPALLHANHSNLQDSDTSDAPCNPQLSGTGTSQGAPPSPTCGGEQTAAGHDLEVVDGGEGGAAGSSGKPTLPHVELKVACGDMIGTLIVHRSKILIGEGTKDEKEVSPTEFERLGGRSATKKWKQSIRLVQDDGELGRPVGEWYVMQGLEQPKKAREAALGLVCTARSVSPPPDRQHGSGNKVTQRRPVRAAARHVSAHVAAEAAGSPEASLEDLGPAHHRGSSRKGVHSRAAATRAAAKAAAAAPPVPDAADLGAMDAPEDFVVAAAAAATSSSAPAPEPIMLPQQPQQFTMQSAASMLSPASSNAGAFDDASEALDAAALGEYHMPPGAAAAAAAMPAADMHSGPLLVPVPVAHPLPGDASQAVVEMTAYLEGRRSVPPWRLLPAGQRPVLGQYLVPLRQLFVLVMQAGGYVRIQDDLLMWQDIAVQMGLPAWPCPDVPDPLRALQQVYRDYLLRFEGRFTLSHAAGAPGVGGHHSPTLSTATQYAGSQQQQQHQGIGAADDNQNNLDSQQQMQMQGILPEDAAAVLEDALSGDLLEFLSDLIPENDAAMPAAASAAGVILRQPSLPGISNAPAAAAAAAYAAEGSRLSADVRQHPEMVIVQQRQRVQQLQQQLHELRQQQQQLQQQQQHRLAPVQSGVAAANSGAVRMKRPPPLIRCGDSDVVTLMDQSELSRLLQDYDEQQHSQQASMQRQQQLAPGMRSQLPPSGRATSSQLAAAIAGAVDRNQSQDLQAIMQQFWAQQGHSQQQQQQQQFSMQAQQQQQQQQALPGNELEPQPAEEEMSGMLEALQLAADGSVMPQLSSEQQQHADMLGRSSSLGCNISREQSLLVSGSNADGRTGGWSHHLMPPRAGLLAQGSVGVHLVSVMPTPGIQQCSGRQPWQQQQQQQAQGNQGIPPPSDHPLSGLKVMQGSASGAAVRDYQNLQQQQQQQQQQGDTSLSSHGYQGLQQQQQQQQGDASLSSLRGGLLRLTTPTSAMFASVLDSPTMRNPGQAWMDVSGATLRNTLSTDLKSMTVELLEADGGQPGPSDADLSAVMRMW